MKKSLAILKRKQVQAHLTSLMESLKQVEDGLKDQIVKNDFHLAALMSLDEKVVLPKESKDVSIAIIREIVSKIAFQCEESLTDVNTIAEHFESQKRIKILLNLRNADNHIIPTFSLFEDGFYSNWSTSENLSTTDRNLMLVSHVIFNILRRWNIALKVKLPPGSLFAAAVTMPCAENRLPPPPLLTVVAPSTSASIAPSASPPNVAEQSFNKTSSNSNSVWGTAAPVLSYSQVLNLPKPVAPPKPLLQRDNELPSFTFRFGQKGNGKFNVPSKFLGEVLVKMKLASHVSFVQELVYFCRKPREIARRIIKVFFKFEVCI